MIRKDPAQDTDRANYYSQFWIEVAAGRPIGLSAQATDEDVEPEETDFEALLSAPPMATPPMAAPRPEAAKPKPKPVEKKEAARSLSSLADLANIADLMNQSAQMEEETVPDIEAGAASEAEPAVVTNFDIGELPTEEEPAALAGEEGDEFEDFGDEEEEEEDDEWGGTRRPKPKPKPPRRDRRGF